MSAPSSLTSILTHSPSLHAGLATPLTGPDPPLLAAAGPQLAGLQSGLAPSEN